MVKKRITRKQLLKEPDEFMTFTGKMIQFARQYRKHIMYGSAAVLLIILTIIGGRYYIGWKEKKAFASLQAVVAKYQALDKTADTAAVTQEFERIVKTYSGYRGGQLARVIYANICYDSGDFDTAIIQYTKAVDDFKEHPTLRPLIQTSLGYAYQAKKDYPAAVVRFETVSSAPNAYLKDEALFNLGLIYAEMGRSQKSREAFEKIVSDFPNSIYMPMAQDRTAG